MITFILKWVVLPGVLVYLALSLFLFWQQERLLFFPERLPQDFRFAGFPSHKEVFIPMSDGERLHALWFPESGVVSPGQVAEALPGQVAGALPGQIAEALPVEGRSDRVILYLHGNAGSLRGWGGIASYYQGFGYDVFIPDYRGFGKSTGRIRSEARFLDDIREVWSWLLQYYEASDVVVIGYSIGSVPAAMLGAEGSPGTVVLKAPMYNARTLKSMYYPIFPDFLLRYQLDVAGFLQQISARVELIHGEDDEIIPVSQSRALEAYLKPGDTLFMLPGQGHNGMNHNPDFHRLLNNILSQ